MDKADRLRQEQTCRVLIASPFMMGHDAGHDTRISRHYVLSPRLAAGSCKHPRQGAPGRTEPQQTRGIQGASSAERPAGSSPLKSARFGRLGHESGSRNGRDPNRLAAARNVPAFGLRVLAGTAPVSRHAPGPARYRRRGHSFARRWRG